MFICLNTGLSICLLVDLASASFQLIISIFTEYLPAQHELTKDTDDHCDHHDHCDHYDLFLNFFNFFT